MIPVTPTTCDAAENATDNPSKATALRFGLTLFPSFQPDQISAQGYFDDCLLLCRLADQLGYEHVRTIEHHLTYYGGCSPSTLIFLTAVSQCTTTLRLICGAVIPAFNHPLRIAGEIGMVDAISHGRLEIGFGRAFIPAEFQGFDIPLDESRARFVESISVIRRLLEGGGITHDGKTFRFTNVTTLPRPTQEPYPPLWIAAFSSPESFEFAGREGYNIMAIPLSGRSLEPLIAIYRNAWTLAGHAGKGKVMLAFHMLCAPSTAEAMVLARKPFNQYMSMLIDAAQSWESLPASPSYPGYPQMLNELRSRNLETMMNSGAVWVGSPDDICSTIRNFKEGVPDFDIASMQVNYSGLSYKVAAESIELFAAYVMPQFRNSQPHIASTY